MPRIRPREWALALWTIGAIAVGVVIHVAVDNPAPSSSCDYCWLDFDEKGVDYEALFVAWAFGCLLILSVDWLVRAELRRRANRRA